MLKELEDNSKKWDDFLISTNTDESKGKKMQISLSEHAMDILNEDADWYIVNKNKKKATNKVTSIINMIVNNYCDDSEINPTNIFIKKEKEIEEILKKARVQNESINEIVDVFLNKEAKEWSNKYYQRIKRGEKRYFNGESVEKLKYIDDYVKTTFEKPSKYVSSLLENYTKLPRYQREGIVWSEYIDTVKTAIREKRYIEINMYSGSFIIEPISIEHNNEKNYILCFSSHKEEKKYTLQAPSLRNIEELHLSDRRFDNNDKKRQESISYARKHGIERVANDEDIFTIVFTQEGLKLIKNIVDSRVKLYETEGDKYKVRSDAFSIVNYLKRFGKEAIVQEASVGEKVLTFYKEAYLAYSENFQIKSKE